MVSTGSLTGSWEFLSLRTGKIIVRAKFTVQPITDRVIAEMNARADACKLNFDRQPRFLSRRRLPETVAVSVDRSVVAADAWRSPKRTSEGWPQMRVQRWTGTRW